MRYNLVLRFLIESYLEYTICSLLNFVNHEINTFYQILSISIAILFFVITIALPLLHILIILKNYSNLDSEDF